MLTAARCWSQRWLVATTMSQDLIGCWNQRKLKALIPRVVVFVNDPPSAERRSILLSFLLFYGLMVGKYALICAMEIQKIHMVVHIFSGFALFTELMWVYRGVESLCKLLTANKVPFDLPNQQASANQNTVHLKTCFIWKLSWEWLLWTGYVYASGGSLRKLDRQLWNIRRKISHRCSSTGCPDVVCVNILIFTWIKWDVSSKLPWTKMVQKSKYNKKKLRYF